MYAIYCILNRGWKEMCIRDRFNSSGFLLFYIPQVKCLGDNIKSFKTYILIGIGSDYIEYERNRKNMSPLWKR